MRADVLLMNFCLTVRNLSLHDTISDRSVRAERNAVAFEAVGMIDNGIGIIFGTVRNFV